MSVPFLDLRRQHAQLTSEIEAALARVISSGRLILGDEVAAFESEWANACGVAGAVGVNSGTDAIALILLATSGEQPSRNEVITSPLSAGYGALAIKNAGFVPVFADIDALAYTLSPAAVEGAITSHTRAILPVHIYGRMAEMPPVCELADRHGLIVIEDAAQAHGIAPSKCRGGGHTHAAAFSFYPTKNLGAVGDGGAVVSDDLELLERVRELRAGGQEPALSQTVAGLNSRLDEIQAAGLRVKLKYLRAWNERRRAIALQYTEELGGKSDLALPEISDSHVFHLYVVQHPDRDRLARHLSDYGIETKIHYPTLLPKQRLFETSTHLPVAERVVRRILSLPLYPQMSDAEVEGVINAIKAF